MKKGLVFAVGMLALSWGMQVAGAENNKTDNELVYRASLGSVNDIELLLSQGGNVNAKNENGVPLLALAAMRLDNANIDVVKDLIAHGADVNAGDAAGQTPLFYAAKKGNKDIVQYLLEHNANYYATDNKGDVARNLAFRENHADIVELMDNFVKKQSEAVQQQYATYNQVIKDRYAAIAQNETPAAITPTPAAPQPAPVVAAEPPPFDAARFNKLLHELSFDACAFEYWSYCRDSRETTDLNPAQLDSIIDTDRSSILSTSQIMINEFKVNSGYLNKIINPSKQYIFVQLNGMHSNTFRRENGVGSNADVKKRCERIAAYWQVTETGKGEVPNVQEFTPPPEAPESKPGNKPLH